MTPATADTYHHGDLPNALRRAAAEVIAERGLGGFSLREVARRAGVSHTAPAHHFGDVRGLLTSLATEGFDLLSEEMTAAMATSDDPIERLTRLGRAYVKVAQTHEAHCSVMFRMDIVSPDDEALLLSGICSYGILEGAVRAFLEAEHLNVDLDTATWMCWSTMQGLVTLNAKIDRINELRGSPAATTDDLVQRFADLIVAGLRSQGSAEH